MKDHEFWDLQDLRKLIDSNIDYVGIQTNNSTGQDKYKQHSGFIISLIELLDRFSKPFRGLRKRLYWESDSSLEMAYVTIGNQSSNLRNNSQRTYKITIERTSGALRIYEFINDLTYSISTSSESKQTQSNN